MNEKVLFISHKEKQCGVYQFGYSIARALSNSKKYNFVYSECNSGDELNHLIKQHNPISVIYNYHPSTLSWFNNRLLFKYNMPQIGIIHEITQEISDNINNSLFDYYIAPDPTLILKNPIVYKTGRLLFDNKYEPQNNNIPVIGSFGFATPNKRFDLIVKKVSEEFEQAIIRLNIPFADFGDKDGVNAKKIVEDCQSIIKSNSGIKLEFSHNFLKEDELLKFLSSNTINVFFYYDEGGRGISSVIDLALSVKVPIAISSDSTMFRHISNTNPSIIYSEDNKFKNIINNGFEPLESFYYEWTKNNLIWDYERIVTDSLKKFKNRNIINLKKVKKYIKGMLGKESETLNSWSYAIQNYRDNIITCDNKLQYKTANIFENDLRFNRILDDEARFLYNSSIKQIHEIIPYWMTRKIERANIQQGFILDTVIRLTENLLNPEIISIGCFEDTAWGALKKLGYNIEGIDPVLNYDLSTFLTKPEVKKNYYDVVFSTSVIEHVEDDLTFLKDMITLAKKGGYIILTCDFKEGYKDGDNKPSVDYRLYTKEYIMNNLISNIKDCKLIDTPNWECPNPDFEFENISYTFASIVLEKIK